jgi:hypothetical protein
VLAEHSQQRQSLYGLLDLLQSGADPEELRSETPRRQEKEKKWVEKSLKYREKPQPAQESKHN